MALNFNCLDVLVFKDPEFFRKEIINRHILWGCAHVCTDCSCCSVRRHDHFLVVFESAIENEDPYDWERVAERASCINTCVELFAIRDYLDHERPKHLTPISNFYNLFLEGLYGPDPRRPPLVSELERQKVCLYLEAQKEKQKANKIYLDFNEIFDSKDLFDCVRNCCRLRLELTVLFKFIT